MDVFRLLELQTLRVLVRKGVATAAQRARYNELRKLR